MDAVDRMLEAFNRGEVPPLTELAATDYSYAEPLFPGPYDAAGHEAIMQQVLDLYPDRTMHVSRRWPGVDGAVLQAKWSGTPADGGDRVEIDLFISVDFDPDSGLIARFRSYYDPLD